MRKKTTMKLMLGALGTSALLGLQADAALTAYWDFEGDFVESVSSTAGTASGIGNDASADGAAIAPTGSNALSVGGNDDVVTANTTGGLSGTGSFTVLAFVNTSSNADGTFFSYFQSGTGGTGMNLIVLGNGNLRIEMFAGAGYELNITTPANLNDGSTHLIAAVFDSGSGDSFQDVDLYVDGAFYDVAGGTDHPVNLAAAGTLRFGTDQAIARDFNGLIDDVAIYDEALSLSQLNDIAVNGVPEPGSLALLGLGGLLIARRRRD